MKRKTLWTGILAGLASICIALGFGCLGTTQQVIADETTFTEVDVTNDIRVHYWDGSKEKDGYQFLINVYPTNGDGTSYNINGYSGNGSALYFNETPDVNGCDVMKYIQVNGVTIRDVVGESGTAGSQVNGGSYTSTNSEFGENGKLAPFRLRTMRFSSMKLNTFDLYISADYIENVVGGLENLEITVKAGIEWKTMPNKDGVNQLMKTTRDRTFEMTEERMSPMANVDKFLTEKATFTEVDMTKSLTIRYWANTESNATENPNYTFLLLLGANVNVKPLVTNGIHFYYNDHADWGRQNGGDMMEYLQINGVTARDVVGSNGTSGTSNGWAQSTDSGFAVNAFAPIQLKTWNYSGLNFNGFELIMTKEFIDETCGGLANVEITLKEGFTYKNTDYQLLKFTRTYTYEMPAEVKTNATFTQKFDKVDITDKMGELSIHSINDGAYYSINGMTLDTELWAPFCQGIQGESMYLNDHATSNGCDLASFIYVNGIETRSVMGDTSYTQNASVNMAKFRPFVVNVDARNNAISLEITKEYLDKNCNGTTEGLLITLKSGFEWKTIEGKILYTTRDLNWKVKDGKIVDTFVSEASVSCQDSLDLNFYVTTRDNVSEMKGTFNGATEPVNGVLDETSGQWKFTYSVAAKDWQKDVSLTLENGTTWTTTVEKYLNKIDESYGNAYTVATALKEYCTAASTYFSNGQATATEDLSADAIQELESKKATLEGEQSGVDLDGLTLELEGKVNLRIYFTAETLTDIVCEVDGTVVTPKEWQEGCYVIVIDNLTATDIDKMFTVIIGGYELTCGAFSYIEMGYDSTDVAFANVVKALYAYNKAADAYFNN